jgi:hypothetical protein
MLTPQIVKRAWQELIKLSRSQVAPKVRKISKGKIPELGISIIFGFAAIMVGIERFVLANGLIWAGFAWGSFVWWHLNFLKKTRNVTKKKKITVHNRTGQIGGVLVIMTLAFFVVRMINTYALDQELKLHTDWLIPASDPQPRTACPDPSELPTGTLTLVMGSNAAYASSFPAAVVVVENKIQFSLNRDPQGRIAITTDVFDSADNAVVEIDHNRFTVANDVFKMERPDLSTLAVYIKNHKEEVLWVRFLNPSTMRIRGVFRWRDAPSVVVTDSDIEAADPGLVGALNCGEIAPEAAFLRFTQHHWVWGAIGGF